MTRVSSGQTETRKPLANSTVVPLVFLIGAALVAANLRASLTGVGSVLPFIQADTGLSTTAAGILGTLPLLAFAATSPLVRGASRKVGSYRLLVGALMALSVGIVLRSLPGVAWLFAGTVVLAIGIAIGNVLLPAVIRRSVPADRIGRVTGFYVTVMGIVAALASGIAVPFSNLLPGGWRSSLSVWCVLGVIALVYVMFTRFGAESVGKIDTPSVGRVSVWSSKLAWQVSIFMGLQSVAFYALIQWLPSIVAEVGVSSQSAGWQLTVFQVTGLVTSTAVPLLTRGRLDLSAVATVSSLVCAAGLAVMVIFPSMSWLSVVLIGLGGGSCLVLALSFQGLRAPDSDSAASLAGMAQTVGYLLAACGPVALGALRDATGSWHTPLIVMTVLAVLQAVFGAGAGRDRQVVPASDNSRTDVVVPG
ncbi:MFS transporter [Rhodococcus sp. IEGM 1381]|uniref:CynX/NimT family MFS transporter n=1 Tax=Rhodococcus sp. IEGM 1381 TaxID=3047085 RepID=UPI0024B73C13|nr:MFS transporter [Rhodococcus sp. IEGM 1381]MDI9897390.1 MFS transporter [Rhodococcus sp. IEGM 1381]